MKNSSTKVSSIDTSCNPWLCPAQMRTVKVPQLSTRERFFQKFVLVALVVVV
jgi:hypothetical protein